MEFRILGPVEVWTERGLVPLGGAKPRAILAVLLLHANTPVKADRLAVALWGEEAPRAAVNRVHVHMSRLRRALAGEAVLITTRAGYCLRVGRSELDANRFASLVEKGSGALAAEEPERAAALLRAALSLWRGPPLANVADEPFAAAEIARLEEQRLAAVEACIDADLAVGRHAAATGELQRLVAAHPTRERLAAQLVIALYRSGRQADALAAYRATRKRLVEELGVEPGRQLQALHEAVLRHDASLEGHSPHAGPGSETRPTPIPLPSVAAAGDALVGRVGELAQLNERWQQVRDGEMALVLAFGEPGVGKTGIATSFMTTAHADGATALYGRSDEEALLPYQPIVEALSHYLEHCETTPRLGAAVERSSALRRMLPALRRHAAVHALPDSGDADFERARLFDAVATVIEAMIANAPALVVLDDLHWADRATLVLLRTMLRRLRHQRLMILGTYRDAELGPSHPLRDWIASLSSVIHPHRIRIAGLDVAATADLVADRVGTRPTETFARQLQRDTSGNPFFMREILRALMSASVNRPLSTDALRGISVPRDIGDVITARVDRLGAQTADLLRVAALAGPSFRRELIADVLGRNPIEVLGDIEAAARAGIIVHAPERPPGHYTFCHVVARTAIVADMLVDRRAQVHAAFARALASRPTREGVRAAEILHHCLEAQNQADPDIVVDAAIRAADVESGSLAYEAATTTLSRAVGALDLVRVDEDDPRRCLLLLRLGQAQRTTSRDDAPATFRRAAAIARRLGDADMFARAALSLRLTLDMDPEWRQAQIDLVEEAIARLGTDDPTIRARLLARLGEALHFSNQPERALAVTRDALDLAPDPATRHAALLGRHTALGDIEHVDERLSVGDALLRSAATLGRPQLAARPLQWRICDLIQVGDLPSARQAHRELVRLAHEHKGPFLEGMAGIWDATWAHMEGRLAAAETLARDWLARYGPDYGNDADIQVTGQIYAIRHDQGRLGEMTGEVERMVRQYPNRKIWRAVQPLALATAGSWDAARAGLERFAGDRLQTLPRDFLWIGAMAYLAEACAVLGDADAANGFYEALLPYRHRISTMGFAIVLGSVEHYLGLLAAVDGIPALARSHLEAAVAVNDRIGAAALATRTRQALAGVCGSGGPAPGLSASQHGARR